MTVNELRKDMGLSYEKFAQKLGVTTNTSVKICSENGCIKMVVAQKIVSMGNGRIKWGDLVVEGDC